MMGSVFAMQGVGQLVAGIMLLIVCLQFHPPVLLITTESTRQGRPLKFNANLDLRDRSEIPLTFITTGN